MFNRKVIVPHVTDIPDALKNLTKADILALRPFQLDCGVYERHPSCYRLKKGMIKLVVSQLSVEQKIQSIADDASRLRYMNAYSCLKNSSDSSYSDYISLHEQVIANNTELNVFNMTKHRWFRVCFMA